MLGKLIFNNLIKAVTLIFVAISFQEVFAQTVFTENMGTPSGTVAIASHTFQNSPGYSYAGTADVRNTTPSTGYTGASGGGNVFITTGTTVNFVIGNINTTGFSALTLSFGQYKSTTTGNNEVVVEVSTDGTTYTPLTYSRPTGSGTASWALVTASGAIPATGNLRIRFRQTSTVTQFRIDDIKLVGTISCTPATSPTTLASSFSATTFCTSAQIAFTGGNGAKRIAVVSTTNFANTPANGTAYAANAAFGSGAQVGTGNYVVLNGTASAITVTGLTSNTTYFIKVFEYNGAAANCDESYLTAGVTSFSFTTQANCATPQIRSLLVDACSSQEGLDELVLFENGANPLSISAIEIQFPSGGDFCNSGCATQTLGNNAAYITQLNATAGCPLFQYADPIPAGGMVVVFTGQTPSYVFNYSTECPNSQVFYAIFCNNSSTAGRFANSGTGTRTLDMIFGANTDQVTYNLANTLGDGTFVDFTVSGIPTYRQEPNCIYPLGVELSFFKGEKTSEGIELSWQTLSERDADYFSVEHADHTAVFTGIAKTDCAGNSDSPIDYSYTDRKPATGMNYYRLRQVDRNGKETYSGVIALDYQGSEFHVSYLPELQQLVFNQELRENSEVKLYSPNGQLLFSKVTSGKQLSAPLALSPGIWLVHVTENGKSQFSRIVVY